MTDAEAALLARNLRRGGFSGGQVYRLALLAQQHPSGFEVLAGGRRLRLRRDPKTGRWQAWLQPDTPRQVERLVATARYALVHRPAEPAPPRRALYVRDLPEPVLEGLRAAAADEGLSLAALVRRELTTLAERFLGEVSRHDT